ncbi:hypothetical protein [Flocculibacter collagenilyticus]|uniref:hypothetical protein n=1 Tax=Flocculibacter collagenilyticus TaxID=2744479 RepID=UPI0018F477F6|nr:hypothetical protein [Flocculibacter collagenilyticus]
MKKILLAACAWVIYLPIALADGYEGLWYELPQYFDVERKISKYSGAMGTATNKHKPLAIYSDQSNKTFFTYGGLDPNSNNNMAIYVGCYDHILKQLCSKPTLITIKDKVVDQHDNASLLIDKDNFIWVYVSGRNTKRPGQLYRSNKQGDISRFEEMKLTIDGEIEEISDFSYPQPWLTISNNKVLLHTQYTDGRELYIRHEDKASVKMVKGGHYAISYAKGDHIVMAYNSHDERGRNEHSPDARTNLYFMQSFDGGSTWVNKDNDPLEILTGARQPLEKFDSRTEIIGNYRESGYYVYLKDIKINNNDEVLILYSLAKTADPTNFSDSRSLHLKTISRTGSVESQTLSGSLFDVNHNYSSGFIDLFNGNIYMPTQDNESTKMLAGGHISILNQSGAYISELTSDGRHHNYIRDVYNKTYQSALDFSFFWSSSDPVKSTQRLPIHYYGTSGSIQTMPMSSLSMPMNLIADLHNGDNIKLTWQAVKNAAYYHIISSTDGGSWILDSKQHSQNEHVFKDLDLARYQYRVKACNSFDHCSSYSSPSNAVTITSLTPSVPNAPTAVLSNSNTITINWDPIEHSSYYVREVSINSGSWINPTTFLGTSAVYANQQVRSYRYRVKACNNNNQCSAFSAPSSTVIVLPPTPSVPNAPTAVISNGNTITINWDPVEHSSYYVREVSINSGSWINPTTFSGTSAVYANQQVRSYRYRVKACNNNNQCSAFSSPSSTVTVQPPYPSIPSAPNASLSNGNTITITWNAVNNASYYIREVSIDNGSWKSPTTFTGTSAAYTNQQVRSYRYRVKACNSDNLCSAFSAPSNTVTVQPPYPSIPSAPNASLSNGNTITITWNAVNNASYYIREVSIDNGSWKNPTTFTGTSAAYTNQQVRSYRYRVKACNSDNLCSAFSAPSNTVTVQPPYPSIPSAPNASLSNGNTITITWNAVNNASYYIREVSIDNGSWKSPTTFTGTSAAYTNQQVRSYRYRVKACNSDNLCSAFSAPSNTVTVQPPYPSIPSAPNASLSNGNTITITWNAVNNASYYIREVSIDNDSWKNPTTFTGTSAAYTNQQVRSYRYRVKACNSDNLCSAFSAPSNTVTVQPPYPSIPSAPNASLSNGNTITITWNAVNNASYYIREVSIDNGSWKSPTTFTGTSAAYTNQQVRSYRYRVKACNSDNLCSAFSAPSNTVTVQPPYPSIPSAPNASLSNGNTITITWNAVNNASYYIREVSIDNGSWKSPTTFTGTSAAYTNQQVRSYRYRVKACNSDNLCSAFSAPSNTVTVY